MSLLELLACVTILAVLVVAIVPRLGSGKSLAEKNSCNVQKEVIEIQAALWKRMNGSWPSSDLSDIGRDAKRFPDGIPVCPVDQVPYKLDSEGNVIGHAH